MATGKHKVTRESIDDVKEMVKDMEQRVSELISVEKPVQDADSNIAAGGTSPTSRVH